MTGDERLARAVHKAWVDGMIKQGRPVSIERSQWETLSAEDKALDQDIGDYLARVVVESMGESNPADSSGANGSDDKGEPEGKSIS